MYFYDTYTYLAASRPGAVGCGEMPRTGTLSCSSGGVGGEVGVGWVGCGLRRGVRDEERGARRGGVQEGEGEAKVHTLKHTHTHTHAHIQTHSLSVASATDRSTVSPCSGTRQTFTLWSAEHVYNLCALKTSNAKSSTRCACARMIGCA
jgi:hypothetical protein